MPIFFHGNSNIFLNLKQQEKEEKTIKTYFCYNANKRFNLLIS